MSLCSETAFAKINLALHVRERLADGYHGIETVFAFCEEGDGLTAEPADDLTLTITGEFVEELQASDDNLVLRAARALRVSAAITAGAALHLDKRLPVASGLGGGSADAAAALRLLGRLWETDPTLATELAPSLGADVPACVDSRPMRGDGRGDRLTRVNPTGISGAPILLVNPRVALATADVFACWDGIDRGPLGDWRDGRNDLEAAAISLVPQIGDLLDWLRATGGASHVRMSGSGATCFALYASDEAHDAAAAAVPQRWWHLATRLR